MIALADDEIGEFKLAGTGRRSDHDMREQGTECNVDLVLIGEFLHHLGTAFRIGPVVFDDQLDLPAGNATGLVDEFHRCLGGALIPPAIGRANAGSMGLEANLDGPLTLGQRLVRHRIGDIATREAASDRCAGDSCGAFEKSASRHARAAAGFRILDFVGHCILPVLWLPQYARCFISSQCPSKTRKIAQTTVGEASSQRPKTV